MSLYRKLVLFMLAATVLPFVVVGFALVRTAEDELRERIRAAQVEVVRSEARGVGQFVRERVEDLRRAAGYFDLSGASETELEGAVRVLYRVAPEVAVTVLVDGKGEVRAPPAHLADPQTVPELADHPPRADASVERLLTFVPVERAVTEGAGAVVISPPYAVPEAGETAFAVALPVATSDAGVLIFAAEVSLGTVQANLAASSAAGALLVVDAEGRAVVHPDPEKARATIDTPEVAHAVAADEAAAVRVAGTDGAVLAAFAPVPVPGLGWKVVSSLAEREAFASVRRMRWLVLAAGGGTIALLLLLGGGFVGGIRRAIGAVRAGAVAYGEGRLEHRIDPPSEEELRDLAETFNSMGEELGAARTRLERWNEDLQTEVDLRTRELREAQARLVQTQKLAAVGQLGAGVAHEINNPLAGVLGNVQLLLMKKRKTDAPESELEILEKMEVAAKRCRDITQTLLRFSQQTEPERVAMSLNEAVEDAAEVARGAIEEQGATLSLELDASAPTVRADPGHLSQVLLHLLSNARIAVSGHEDAPSVTVETRGGGDTVTVVVRDNGDGIDAETRGRIFEPFFTTKKEWTSLGLGLAVTYRIVEEHEGSIDVESTPGEGTSVSVTLPAG